MTRSVFFKVATNEVVDEEIACDGAGALRDGFGVRSLLRDGAPPDLTDCGQSAYEERLRTAWTHGDAAKLKMIDRRSLPSRYRPAPLSDSQMQFEAAKATKVADESYDAYVQRVSTAWRHK